MSIRFIHSADWQIGMTRHFLDDDGQARFTEAREQAIRRIAAIAEAERAAFVVVAGDVFDANILGARVVWRALEAISEISVPVYLLPGNHDALDSVSLYRQPEFLRRKPASVTVLDSTEIRTIAPGVELVGVPLRSRKPSRDLVGEVVAGLPSKSAGTVRIVVGHGQPNTMALDASAVPIEIEVVEQAIQQRRMDFLALGDRHSTTSVGDTGRIWFSGAPEPTDYDETDAGNVLLVDLDEHTCSVKVEPTGQWQFILLRLDLLPGRSVAIVEAALSTITDPAHRIVKLELIGTITVSEKIAIDRLVEDARQTFAAIERPLHHDDLALMPDDYDDAGMNLSGFAKAAMERIKNQAKEPKAEAAQNALALLYRLAGR